MLINEDCLQGIWLWGDRRRKKDHQTCKDWNSWVRCWKGQKRRPEKTAASFSFENYLSGSSKERTSESLDEDGSKEIDGNSYKKAR